MKFIVELHTRNMHGAHLETWRYSSRDLAICRVTQLLIANPTADLNELTVAQFGVADEKPASAPQCRYCERDECDTDCYHADRFGPEKRLTAAEWRARGAASKATRSATLTTFRMELP